MTYEHLWLQDGKWEAKPGGLVYKSIVEAIHLASTIDQLFSFKQNGVTITVSRYSNPALIYQSWDASLRDRITPFHKKKVGP